MPDGEVDNFYIKIVDWMDYYESANKIIANSYDGNIEEFPRNILDDKEKFMEWAKEQERKTREKNKKRYDDVG